MGVKPDAFLTHGKELKEDRRRSPLPRQLVGVQPPGCRPPQPAAARSTSRQWFLKSLPHQPVFEFADKYAKVVVLISIQDFRRNGQAHFAVKEWAAQLEKLLRTKSGEEVADSVPEVLVNF